MKLRNKKTGEIVDLSIFGITLNIRKEEQPTYHSIEGVCEDWEDYKPAEPLIKDERIRKAVRAWAEANDIEDGITYLGDGEFRSFLNTTIDFAILVDEHRFDLLKKGKDYTIAELCGEEKE